jgi:hypothetical protein
MEVAFAAPPSPLQVAWDVFLSESERRLGKRERDDRDRRAWIESRVVIRNKKRERVPLILNVPQQRIWSMWKELGFTGVRCVVHKARQEGVSTLVLATFLEEVCHRPNTTAVIVDREAMEAHRKLRVLKFMYDNLPPDEKPKLSHNNRNEMVFPELNSSIYVGKAGARKFGRGDTIHLVLLSEIAFYPDPESIVTGITEAVPNGEGLVVFESTANGAETYWHNFYRQARDGQNTFRAIFLPWWALPEYRQPQLAGEAPLVRTTEEQQPPFDKLDDDQLRWRREKAKILKERVEAEDPSTDEGAFLRSGRTRFDIAALLVAKAAAPNPLRVEDGGALTIYAEPEDGKTYTVAADVAEGLPGGDYDAAVLVDDASGVEVAVLWGKWPFHVFADKLAALGRRYTVAKPATIAVERNNTGSAVLQRLLLGGEGVQPYRRERIYAYRDYDQATQKTLPRPGWPTTSVTKPLMESALERLIADHPECFRDQRVLSELLSLVYLRDGSVGAPQGAHDDLAIARMIVEAVRPESLSRRSSAGFTGAIFYGEPRRRVSPLGDLIDPNWIPPRGLDPT